MYAAVLNTPFIMPIVESSQFKYVYEIFSAFSPCAVSSAITTRYMILITVQCIHKVSRRLELGYLITY